MCLTEENFSILLEFSSVRIALITYEVATAKYSEKYKNKFDKRSEKGELNKHQHLFKYMKKHHPSPCRYFDISVVDVQIAGYLLKALYDYEIYRATEDCDISFNQFLINQ